MLKIGKFNKSAKELLENSFKSIYARDEKERIALHYAVEAKTVSLLVEKGANVNAADVEGIHSTASSGNGETSRNRERIDKVGSKCKC